MRDSGEEPDPPDSGWLLSGLSRALVAFFMSLNALFLGLLVERSLDSAWAMLGTVAVCFVAAGILFPDEPL